MIKINRYLDGIGIRIGNLSITIIYDKIVRGLNGQIHKGKD